MRFGRLVGRSAEGAKADVAQLAERVLGKDEVTSSILVIGSIVRSAEVWSDEAGRRRVSDGEPAQREWTDRFESRRRPEVLDAVGITKAIADISNGETQACRKKNLIVQSRT